MKLRKPSHKTDVWIHVDEFDKHNGRTWAVQWWSSRHKRWMYSTTKKVRIYNGGYTKTFKDKQQPRAVIVCELAQLAIDKELIIVR